jgi:hypothetical protein
MIVNIVGRINIQIVCHPLSASASVEELLSEDGPSR